MTKQNKNIISALYLNPSDLYEANRVVLKKQQGKNSIIQDKATKGLYLYYCHYYDFDSNQVYESIPSLNANLNKILPYCESKKYFYNPQKVFLEDQTKFLPLEEFVSEETKSTFDIKEVDEELLYQLYAKTNSLYLGPVNTIHKNQKTVLHYHGCSLLLNLEDQQYYDPMTSQVYENINLVQMDELINSKTKSITQNVYSPVSLKEVNLVLPEYINLKTVLEFAEATQENHQEAQEYYVRKRG